MPLIMTCAGCQSRFEVEDRFAGRTGRCPQCGALFTVPRSAPLGPASLPEMSSQIVSVPTGPARSHSLVVFSMLLVAALVLMGGGGLALVLWKPWDKSHPAQPVAEQPATHTKPTKAPPSARTIRDAERTPAHWVEQLGSPEPARLDRAIDELKRLGPKAVPALRSGLKKSPDAKIRRRSAELLGQIGPDASEASDDLGDALTDSDPLVRMTAATVLGLIGPRGRDRLPQLLAAVGDVNPQVREAVLTTLQSLAPLGPADVPVLKQALTHRSSDVRVMAARLLRSVSLDAPTVLSIFTPLLKDQHRLVQVEAIRGLGRLGRANRDDLLLLLIPLLSETDAEVRAATLAALSQQGQPTVADLPTLRSALKNLHTDVRSFAALALAQLGSDAAPAIPELMLALHDGDRGLREAVANCLARIGKSAAASARSIRLALKDPEPTVRRGLVECLGAIGHEPEALTGLFEALGDESPEVRDRAALALDKLTPPLNKDDVPQLRVAVKSRHPSVRRLAVQQLAKLEADAQPAMKELLEAARERDLTIRIPATAALAHLTLDAKEAMPTLLESLTGSFESPASEKPLEKKAGSGEQSYRRLLNSTVWVVIVSSFGQLRSWGSGWVVDSSARLIVTNYHVVEQADQVAIFFPVMNGKKPITEPKEYLSNAAKIAVKGLVVGSDPSRDLAIVQVASLPASATALPLAREAPEPGSEVHSLGASGVNARTLEGTLWRYTAGKVRQVYTDSFQFRNGQRGRASIVETDSAVNPGDSGGPVINDKGELVGVVSNFVGDKRNVSCNIEAAEVRRLMNEWMRQRTGKGWQEKAPAARVAEPTQLMVPPVVADLRRHAMLALKRLGPSASSAVPELCKAMPKLDPATVGLVLDLFAELGPEAKDCWPSVIALAESPEWQAKAASTLAKLGKGIVPNLIRLSEDRNAAVRVLAITALGDMGKDAREAVLPLSRRLMAERHPLVKTAIRDAMQKIQR